MTEKGIVCFSTVRNDGSRFTLHILALLVEDSESLINYRELKNCKICQTKTKNLRC